MIVYSADGHRAGVVQRCGDSGFEIAGVLFPSANPWSYDAVIWVNGADVFLSLTKVQIEAVREVKSPPDIEEPGDATSARRLSADDAEWVRGRPEALNVGAFDFDDDDDELIDGEEEPG
jgi:hypothetical protein